MLEQKPWFLGTSYKLNARSPVNEYQINDKELFSWFILVLKNYSWFIWNSNITRCCIIYPAILFQTLKNLSFQPHHALPPLFSDTSTVSHSSRGFQDGGCRWYVNYRGSGFRILAPAPYKRWNLTKVTSALVPLFPHQKNVFSHCVVLMTNEHKATICWALNTLHVLISFSRQEHWGG